jgi:hypothetical protein
MSADRAAACVIFAGRGLALWVDQIARKDGLPLEHVKAPGEEKAQKS